MKRYGHRGPHEMELFAPGSEMIPTGWRSGLQNSAGRISMWKRSGKTARRMDGGLAAFRVPLSRTRSAATRKQARNRGGSGRKPRGSPLRSDPHGAARPPVSPAVGEVTGPGDGIFFLSLDEMTAVLAGDKAPLSAISRPAGCLREIAPCRLTRRSSSGASIPSVGGGPQPAQRYFRRRGRSRSHRWSRDTITRVCRRGRLRGGNRTPHRSSGGWQTQIQPGEILVTVTTNIGWTPLFPRLAAIVTDVGAPLSHAAIVARELGIPAVVGCGNATTLLKTGDRVRVDGGAPEPWNFCPGDGRTTPSGD